VGAEPQPLTGLVLLGTIALRLAVYLSENLLPGAGHRGADGRYSGDQSISFQAMRGKLQDFMKIIPRRSGGG
jgi:multidrug efflux pump